jgi:hypothetical protein
VNLRQRIKLDEINCQPWKQHKGEIRLLCVSGQCLFSNKGLSWDILEIELKGEGWLDENESLWDVLKSETRLKAKMNYKSDESPFDDSWTDEDYKYFYENGGIL